MADGIVQLPVDSTGKKLDTDEITVGANTVERQRVTIADTTTAAGVARIKNADPATSDYGLTVRALNATAANLKVDASGVAVPITDNSGSLTVDQATGTNLHVVVDSVAGVVTTNEINTGTSAQTSVAGSATVVTILVSNANRIGATVFNDSPALLYLHMGASASTTVHAVQLQGSGYYEVPFGYTGILTGLWTSATGNARVVEFT